MERTQQALAPQWLQCTGNVAGGGLSAHSGVCSPFQGRKFRSNSEKLTPRFLDRSSLSDSRHSLYSNGSTKHPYSSFTRSHRDKNRDREKEKSISEDIWGHGSSEPLESILASRVDNIGIRRSQSLVSRKPDELLPLHDSKKSAGSQNTGNGVLSGQSNVNGIRKSTFEKDFPSLGAAEKQDVNGIKRVLSPTLSSPVQSLPMGSSRFLGGEKWTSALVEVPDIVSNKGPLQQNRVTLPTSTSGASSTGGLNMAEALSQPPAQVCDSLLPPDKSQRLEELAIKQSRQLIPMTPSLHKPLVKGANGLSGEKTKQPRIAVRNEMIVASKGVPQHSPHLSNHSRFVQNRSDSPNTHHSGFLVLKPGRENGITISTKDASFSTGDTNSRVLNGQISSLNNSGASFLENKVAALSIGSRFTMDKKSSQSLTQSRSEFFNLMRMKTSVNAKTIISDSSSAVPSPSKQRSTACPPILENGNEHEIPEESKDFCDVGEKELFCNGEICPDEEEVAFLRSLGWEENGGEDEGLTEEEINTFFQEYMNMRPSSGVSS